jgi:hypothetical protein
MCAKVVYLRGVHKHLTLNPSFSRLVFFSTFVVDGVNTICTAKSDYPTRYFVWLDGAVSVFVSFLVKFLLPILFGIENPDEFIVSIAAQKENINASLFMQSLASTWGMFLLPALLFTQVLRYDIGDFFRLNKVP